MATGRPGDGQAVEHSVAKVAVRAMRLRGWRSAASPAVCGVGEDKEASAQTAEPAGLGVVTGPA